MKKTILLFSAITLFVLLISFFLNTGCQRETNSPGGNTPGSNEPAVNDNEMVAGGIGGIVVDASNQPVEGALVTSGTSTTTTNRYGSFSFSNINLSKANAYVKVTKMGYFNGSRTFIAKAGRIHNVRIKLLSKTNSGSFAAASGGTINIAGGGKLIMPADAITDASGISYTGTVNVAMTWIDPASSDLASIIPGDLRGLLTGGQERGLETFGMLGVELTGGTGQLLKVATGKTAELNFPIPPSLLSNAPATIDMWNFDEASGRWKQEGTATKTGSYYITRVSHFSFWNCDAQFPVVELCMNLVSAGNNNPLNNVQVRIKRPNGSYSYGRTDLLGNLCGKVPKNEVLVLEVLSQCNTTVYSQSIGPYMADASAGTISVTIPATNSLVITGTLTNCANANVTNGAVVIYTGNGNSYVAPVTNGSFSVSLLRCDNTAVEFSVLGIDYASLQQGVPITNTGVSGTVSMGTIQACGTSSAQFVEFLIDGSPMAFVEPPDNIIVLDTSFSVFNNTVHVDAFKAGGTNTSTYSSLRFNNNGTVGTQPLISCRINSGVPGAPGSVAEVINTPSPTVNITGYGPPVTGFIEGNFNIQMLFSGTPKTVVCTFKVRRN